MLRIDFIHIQSTCACKRSNLYNDYTQILHCNIILYMTCNLTLDNSLANSSNIIFNILIYWSGNPSCKNREKIIEYTQLQHENIPHSFSHE